jgi:hypothetical protein
MNKIKAGDIVVCVESCRGQVVEGKEYQVLYVSGASGQYVHVYRSDNGLSGGYYSSRFKLKEQPSPQPLTWTMEEIGKVLDHYFDFKDGSSVDFILRELVVMKQSQDPEYPKYLELKKKFEGS